MALQLPKSRRTDPQVAYSFEVFTEDTTIPRGTLGFSEVSGLRSTTNVIEYKEGTDNYVRKLLGRTTVENLTLRRGLDLQAYLRRWYDLVREDIHSTASGQPSPEVRKTLYVKQKSRGAGRDGEELRTWILRHAWPCSLEVSDFRGDADEATIESLEICYEIQEEDITILNDL